MDGKQWCSKCMANYAYAKGAKLSFKSGIFVPSSKRSFFIVFFEMRMISLFITHTLRVNLTIKLLIFLGRYFYVYQKRLKNFLRH